MTKNPRPVWGTLRSVYAWREPAHGSLKMLMSSSFSLKLKQRMKSRSMDLRSIDPPTWL